MIQAPLQLQPHNPDVLMCIANLSNDEVFTPPELVNQMLDTLEASWSDANDGASIWENKEVTFLDPCTKSGVFLREIVKRLTIGLEREFPDLTERVNHILTKQVYGIAITELTSLLARRSLYCSKFANGIHSVARVFKTEEGNIWFERTEHTWEGGNCKFCGASKAEYARSKELESHAYAFTHSDNVKSQISKIFGGRVQFDVVIGNPPYQLNLGNTGGNSARARAIYHEFVSQAIALDPRMVVMVIPSRWMTRSTEGIPDEWIDGFIDDHRIRVLHDYLDSKACFPGVDIKGGVCYFLWNRDSAGKCEYILHRGEYGETTRSNIEYLNSKGVGIVVRDVNAISIVEKIEKVEGSYLTDTTRNFSGMVSPKNFFSSTDKLTSNWTGFSLAKTAKTPIKCYLNKSNHGVPFGYVSERDIPKNLNVAKYRKVYIPAAAWGAARESDDPVLGKPFLGEANSVCTQTYLVIGYEQSQHTLSEQECINIISYISTKFFRYLVSLKKRTQNGPRGVYQFVPLQDFTRSWSDKQLYKRYGLSDSEIEVIENAIRPMVDDHE